MPNNKEGEPMIKYIRIPKKQIKALVEKMRPALESLSKK